MDALDLLLSGPTGSKTTQGGTMNTPLKGKKIAILATDECEQVELTDPRKNLKNAGATVEVISIKSGRIKGWNQTDWGETVKVDHVVKEAGPQEDDSLVLPGGQINPDSPRIHKDAIVFIKAFVQAGKPVAAICHGLWTLIDAGTVKGKKMTSWPTLHKDLQNAGAKWVDQEVVRDGNIITSRKPEDIPAFSNALIEAISTNVPGQQMAGAA
jgi:protease I